MEFEPHFNGPDYEPDRDHRRLSKQSDRILDLMIDGRWRTVAEIAAATNDPENSIQAQLRHLRKPRFGSYIVEKKRRGDSLYLYHVRARTEEDGPPPPERISNKQAGELVTLCINVAKWLDGINPTAAMKLRARVNEITSRSNE
jgi:hypothetical protein